MNKLKFTRLLLTSKITLFVFAFLIIQHKSSFGNILNLSNTPKQTKTNLEIIDSLVNLAVVNSFQSLKHQISTDEVKEIKFKTNLSAINDNFEYEILKNISQLKSDENHKIIMGSGIKSDFNLYYHIKSFQIEYDYNEDNDTYNRKIDLSFECFFTDNNQKKQKEFYSKEYEYDDIIDLSNIKTIENDNFPITKGKINKEESSFFDDLIEPIIITGTIAVSVILLFTIRSN